jgi:hypothetical protein
VLAAVKDAARRASARWPAAILDRCCARRPAGRQAGTKKRPPVSRTKKHVEVGSTGLPSKGVALLPTANSEEAIFLSSSFSVFHRPNVRKPPMAIHSVIAIPMIVKSCVYPNTQGLTVSIPYRFFN